MTPEVARTRFVELWRRVFDLESAIKLMEWDQETNMPAGGAAARSRTLAMLAGLHHDYLTDPELAEAIDGCVQGDGDDALWQAQQRQARRRVERAARIPKRLAEELAAACSDGLVAWQQARQNKQFQSFAGPLGRIVGLKREEARALASEGSAYDALLDLYEPGSTEEGLTPLFQMLRDELVPLVKEIAACEAVDETAARGDYPLEEQRRFGAWVIDQIGFDLSSGRIDRSAHPFCVGLNRGDVRLTWRGDESDFRPALMGFLHEAGHGLYEQGLPEGLEATPAGDTVSLGIHESQSRLWEILVGRGKPFWHWLLPHFRRAFPNADCDLESLWRALHVVRPSLIRVEADEVTYNLHVIVRFELERALFSEQLAVDDLPAAWDDLYEEVVGIRPGDAAEGVLQDLHWASGAFGYFPTYTLGTLGACQLFAAAGREIGDLDRELANGSFSPLLDWLRDRVHGHASRYQADELMRRASGEELSPIPFLDYVRRTARDVYGVG